jgi:hypothetical protein
MALSMATSRRRCSPWLISPASVAARGKGAKSARLDENGLVKPMGFCVPRDAPLCCAALETELIAFVKDRLAPFKYPRWIKFIDELPKTASGKIQRSSCACRKRPPSFAATGSRYSWKLDSGGGGLRGGDEAGTGMPARRINATGCSAGGMRSGTKRHAAIRPVKAARSNNSNAVNTRQRARLRCALCSSGVSDGTASVGGTGSGATNGGAGATGASSTGSSDA